MKDGFISVATCSPPLHLADCSANAQQSIAQMLDAEKAGVQLLCLPELGLTGYTCDDLLRQQTLLDGAKEALSQLCQASQPLTLLTVVGLPLAVDGLLYNCAAVVQAGKILGVVPKKNLPNYAEFYEKRHFATPAATGTVLALCGQEVPFGCDLLFRCRQLPELVLGIELCEDLWVPQPPSTMLCAAGATVIANLSASNETVGKADYRRLLLQSTSARLVCGYLFACAGTGESSSDLVFGSHNLIAENGVLLAESQFQSNLLRSELDVARLVSERQRMQTYADSPSPLTRSISFSLPLTPTTLTRPVAPLPFVPADTHSRTQRCEQILHIAAQGLVRRLSHTQSHCAVLGLSGGLDSTLALLIARRAMALLNRPSSDILALTMPCFGTTERTKNNAVALADCVGAQLQCIDIGNTVCSHFQDIGHSMEDQSTTFENAQARERTQVLMDVANRCNGLVVGTGDLSELALGWATYNGDHMSMYGVNSSIPKTLVRYLVAHVAGQEQDAAPALSAVLQDILDTPVSPELLPAADGQITQKTEDLVGPYQLHDFFLYYMLRFGFSPGKIYRLAQYSWSDTYNDATILHWLSIFYRRFFYQQFKRSCLPDGPKVGSVALSPRGDWRMPSDALSTLWLAEVEALEKKL